MTRCAALLFALVLAVAPVAEAVCEVLCARSESSGEAQAHLCHEAQPETSGDLLVPGAAHHCGHAGLLPAADTVASTSSVVKLWVAPVVIPGAPDTGPASAGVPPPLSRPPGRIAVPIPLRI